MIELMRRHRVTFSKDSDLGSHHLRLISIVLDAGQQSLSRGAVI
jgi:hypothetical protein